MSFLSLSDINHPRVENQEEHLEIKSVQTDEKDFSLKATPTCSLEIKCPQSGAASREGLEVREGERRTELDLEVGEVMTRGR